MEGVERERAVEHAQGEPLWLALMEALRSQSWHGSKGGAQRQWRPQRGARSHGVNKGGRLPGGGEEELQELAVLL